MAQVDWFVALIKVIESLVNCHLILVIAKNLPDHSIVGPTNKCSGVSTLSTVILTAAVLLREAPRRGVS